MSDFKYDLFTDEISLKLLHANPNMIVVRNLLKELKKAVEKDNIIKSQSDLEEFKNFERKHIENSIEAVQYDNNTFGKLKLQVNPYLIFVESRIAENGAVDNAENDIILQPNFIPFNYFHYVPSYLHKNDKQLKKLKLQYKNFSLEQIAGIENDKSALVIDLLKSFLLKQYLIIAPENE
ncbi:hypothetical protein ACR1PO_07390 [Chryseobacterium sp. RRHN12]|uniref:hypothetical protein n=1 Tax=Chryseobacterium sp. RRHN12 TaxID=3437884 RepID=UPI003D9BC8CC